MSHSDLLRYIVKNACRRYNLNVRLLQQNIKKNNIKPKKEINVLFGGRTAERQVSVMSGTNIWLKLRNSDEYNAKPYFLDMNHNVWELPYSKTLNHTVEEIQETCINAKEDENRLHYLKSKVLNKLNAEDGEITENIFLPKKMSLNSFIKKSDFVFIGLHGGMGEDGTLQKMLENSGVYFNGSGSKASNLCMNKYLTGKVVEGLKDDSIHTAAKILVEIKEFSNFKSIDYKTYWKNLKIELGGNSFIVKPQGDGCSAGIARLHSFNDLEKYIKYASKGEREIPNGVLKNQHGVIEMPHCVMEKIIFEHFVITDKVRVIGNKLKWQTKTNWIEITVGILEKDNMVHAFSPSITVAVGNILTLEEKFQGGTGINITPPPTDFVKPSIIKKVKAKIEKVAKSLSIKGYARIDAFMHIKTGELIIIEANTTPGLTPSTVIYQQALSEKPPIYPTELLERIVENGEVNQ